MRRDVVAYSGGLEEEEVSEHVRARNEDIARMIAKLTGVRSPGSTTPAGPVCNACTSSRIKRWLA